MNEINENAMEIINRISRVVPQKPAVNPAEKNQAGMLDMNVQIRDGIERIKNSPRVRKTRKEKSIVRFIDSI